ncbi:Rieske (2Fe-2S) protein [Nocardioides sp.]|uniref:Rieske (2Fe-2S) protein n=1 Tax=Nocardioides sp. TaxID=35761 RepID=UPI0039E5A947
MTTTTPSSASQLTRRSAILGAAGLGIGTPLLAACDDGSTSEVTEDPASSTAATSPSAISSDSTTSDSTTSDGATSDGATSAGAAPAGDPIASTDDIEVGGGTIFADEDVVVTQPEAGTFKAFSATCTHKQCTVSKVEDQQIVCTCHYSKFSIEDGSVESGPASTSLPEESITVANGQIYLG